MNCKSDVDAAVADVDFDSNQYQLQIDTNQGTIVLDLLPEHAPNHCKNMIGLSKSGFYDGLIFHRIIEGFMIQGGCPDGTGMGGPGYNVDAEFNSLSHEPGVVSMARSSDPNSAGSQFFICLDKHAHLDGSYTAFGRTADEASLEIVRNIGSADTGDQDRPVDEIKITKVTVVQN